MASAHSLLKVTRTSTIRHATTSREAFVPGVQLALERPLTLPPGLTLGLEQLL